MSSTAQFPRLRAAMTRKDPGSVILGNILPHPEGHVADWNPREIAVAQILSDKRDLYEDLGQPRLIVSPRFQSVLRECVPDRVQFLAVQLQSSDGEHQFQGFAVLQILHTMPLHVAQSQALPDDIFKLPASSRDVRVTASLQARLQAARLSGLEFV